MKIIVFTRKLNYVMIYFYILKNMDFITIKHNVLSPHFVLNYYYYYYPPNLKDKVSFSLKERIK